MRISKTLILISSIIILLIIIKVFFIKPSETKAPPGGGGRGGPVNATAIIVKPQSMEQVIFASGTVSANEEVTLHPEVAGRVVKINFSEGSRVSKGSLLVKINDADLQAQLQKTNLEVKLAEERLQRNEKLLQLQGISRQEYDVLLNQVQALKADRDVIQSQIEKTEIRAPFNGVIGLKSMSEGGYVTPQTTIASLQQIDLVKINFSVPEKYSSAIGTGTEIKFTVGSSAKEYTAKIYAIEPKVDEVTRTVQMRAVTKNSNEEVLPGAFARISIVLSQQGNALMIPTESIVPVLKGKQVYLYRSGKAEAVSVETGIRKDSIIEIVKGLRENDTVLTTGIMQLRPGVDVNLMNMK